MVGLRLARPSAIKSVGGFLGQRFDANREARLKDALLSEQFIRLHEEKRYDDWFWIGEQVGKWLDASTYAGLIANDGTLLDRVEEVLDRLAASQEPDGYLGIANTIRRLPARGVELYEMYYMLHGLLVCADQLGSDVALQTAKRLGEFIIKTWGTGPGQFPLAGRYPGNGHGGGEGTLILEPIAMLGQRTGDERFIRWGEDTLHQWDAWFDVNPQAIHTCGYLPMKRFAAGEQDVYELRENIHAHTFHMTLLGVAALYNATGKSEYRDVVLGCVDRLAREWIFLTGGMSSSERYVPRRYYHHKNQIEVCPQHTWILLLAQSLEWTGEACYAAEIERDLFNHFLAAQLADGSNWSYFTPLNGQAHEPSSPNCCNAAGHRIAGRMPTYLYCTRDGAPAVSMYTESEAVLSMPNLPEVRLRQETAFPAGGEVLLRVNPASPARFPLHLRIPPYAEGATVQVGGTSVAAVPGEWAIIEREWRPGDIVKLSLPLKITAQGNQEVMALIRGPLVYAYFQDAQADPVVFHDRRGRYPEDVVLDIDPGNPEKSIAQVETPEGMLGPIYRVPGHVRPKAPIFSEPSANSQLSQGEDVMVDLHPFVNQGAIRGEYGVFMAYRKG